MYVDFFMNFNKAGIYLDHTKKITPRPTVSATHRQRDDVKTERTESKLISILVYLLFCAYLYN